MGVHGELLTSGSRPQRQPRNCSFLNAEVSFNGITHNSPLVCDIVISEVELLGIEPRTSYMQNMRSSTELHHLNFYSLLHYELRIELS